jgi:hypothetical protein
MLAAEQGHPLKGLDRSVQPPIEERELIASGGSWDGIDDERLSQLPNLPDSEPEMARAERRHRGGLLGWLFGDEEEEPPPPPRPGR